MNIPRSANIAEIKASYRRLALQFHPDTSSETNRSIAEENFKKISIAYQTLSDFTKKNQYDKSIGNYYDFNKDNLNNYHTRVSVKARSNKTIESHHYDVKKWNAWHYGDDAVILSSIKYKNNNIDPNNKHQNFFHRKNNNSINNDNLNMNRNIHSDKEWKANEDEIDGDIYRSVKSSNVNIDNDSKMNYLKKNVTNNLHKRREERLEEKI